MYEKFNEDKKIEKIYCEDCSFWCNDYERCGCYFLQYSPKRREGIFLTYTKINIKNDCKYFEKARCNIFGNKRRDREKHIEELDR